MIISIVTAGLNQDSAMNKRSLPYTHESMTHSPISDSFNASVEELLVKDLKDSSEDDLILVGWVFVSLSILSMEKLLTVSAS